MNRLGLYTLCIALSGALACIGLSRSFAEDKAAKPQAVSPQAAEFFEAKVRPLLFEKCFGCHGSKQQMGNLRLDSLAAMQKGNSGGPAVFPGDPDRSPIIQVIRFDGKVKMPPAGKLKADEIATLTEWVKIGAPWPGAEKAGTVKAANPADAVEEVRRKHWAFRPITTPKLPTVKNMAWVQSPLDRFILAKLEAKGLAPAPRADKRTLLRRAYFGLIGLPPTAEETSAFLADKSPDAFAKVVDRLLASPRYGERWGRYWLDVARYADTKGYVFTEDANYYNAYTYRDWVIRSLNEDLPYDQFILHQLAADLIPLGDDRRPLAALGFLTVGRRFLNDPVLIADDRMDTVMRGVMGLTVACARCHDHKYDPIPTKDYYSIYGVFASMTEPNPPPAISPKEIREPFEAHNKQIFNAEQEVIRYIRGQVSLLREKIKQPNHGLPPIVEKTLQAFRVGTQPDANQERALMPHFESSARDRIQELRKQIETLRKSMPPTPEFAMAVQDTPNPVEPVVFLRGNPNNRGEAVPRRFLAVLSEKDRKPFQQGSGRLEMARAITDKSNPLTARVLVNRVWMYHFGNAIVRTPGDFGVRSEPPTHPEMLDYLASRFIAEGWSLKKLHRTIMLSNAYQMSSDHPQQARAIHLDPENRLIWRQNRQRLDLEAMRDALLFASGQLDLTMGGKAVNLMTVPFTKRRTVYGFIERQNLPGFFRNFDFATPDISTPQRSRTMVPQQALFMMNSPFVVEQARALLRRPEVASASDEMTKLRAIYRAVLGRSPSSEEIRLSLDYLKQPSTPRPASAWSYGYGELDEQTKRVKTFTPLPHWTGNAWQGSAQMPDPKLHYLLLTSNGGHVGIDAQHAAIRRWTAPQDATLSIQGLLKHSEAQGNGVQGWIISSRNGELGRWTAHNGQAQTNVEQVTVKKGDTVDFVVEARGDHSFDSFLWSPTLKVVATRGLRTVAANSLPYWSAESDFSGPASAEGKGQEGWDKLAHALLMTNEFLFVD